MPRLPVRSRSSRSPRVVVLGDLVVDVVLAPREPLRAGTDVAGRVQLRQGGSAANTARWLARLGARTTLVTAVGRDPVGRALIDVMTKDRVTVRASRRPGVPTGRIGVVVSTDGERSFIADRGAADELRPGDVEASWLESADLLHLPAYSLIGRPLRDAAGRAIELARGAGAAVSLDLASIGPLLARGPDLATETVRAAAPDLLFATAAEARALLTRPRLEDLLELAPVAVVKRGLKGATVLAVDDDTRLRFEVATGQVAATDTTGAGDAFDAGFLLEWLLARRAGRSLPASLQRAAVAGHRAARRHLLAPRPDLPIV